MNLDELQSVQRAERQRDSLQPLRDSFYGDVAGYLRQLKDERQRAVEVADDPFASPDVRQLTDEIETAQEIANAIYERRVGKVVKLASFSAAEMETDEDGMTAEEQELFDDLVARIRRNRKTVLSTLDGKPPVDDGSTTEPGNESTAAASPTPTADATDTTDTAEGFSPDGVDTGTADSTEQPGSTRSARGSTAAETDAAGVDEDGPLGDREHAEADLLSDALGDSPVDPSSDVDRPASDADRPDRPTDEAAAILGERSPRTESTGSSTPDAASEGKSRSAASGASGDPDAPDRTTVRITADIGSILGVDDMEYDLERDDVVVLPTTNAEPLIERDAAERFE